MNRDEAARHDDALYRRYVFAMHDLAIIPSRQRFTVEPSATHAYVNDVPLWEARHIYYFWQAINPVLDRLDEWAACRGRVSGE